MNVVIKRIYEKASPADGTRVLVDRLWPRGISKQRARLDLWAKDIAPSNELRKWFGHDPKKWMEFRKKYLVELKRHEELLNELKQMGKRKRVTLLYAAKDFFHNEAIVVKEVIEKNVI